MANQKKILKKPTAGDQEYPEIGITVPGSGQVSIEPGTYKTLAEEIDVNGDLATDIRSGLIVVNDGADDLPIEEGIDYLKHPDNSDNIRFDVPAITEGDFGSLPADGNESVKNAIRNSARVVRVSATDTRTRHLEDKIIQGPGINITKEVDGVTGEETLKFDSTGNFEGKGFQVSFIGNGAVKDEWLQQEDANIESNHTPNVFKFTGRLVAVSFENENQNVDQVLIFAIRRYPYTNLNNIDEQYKWTLNGCRFASRTHSTLGFTVNPGDAMAVYSRDAGGDANDVAFTMDFIVTDGSNNDMQFNASGDFQSNDLDATGSIPEILE